MFSFHTHEIQLSLHKIENDYWEETLEKIYKIIVLKHKPCLGLVSNTTKLNKYDKIGTFSIETNFIFKKSIDPNKHGILIQIDKEKFNSIFNEYLNFKPNERSDFYHLKEKFEIGMEILIYPLYNKLDKKAFIILDYPTDKIVLDRICNEIIRILS